MRTLAIGDIHGCLSALATVVRHMAITDADLLITLGDYVDRGPESRQVLDWLIARQKRGAGLVALKGNHEAIMQMALDSADAQRSWMNSFVGGDATLRSYSEDSSMAYIRDIPREHWDFIESLRRYHETEQFIFVHAAVDHLLPMPAQKEEVLLWDRFGPQPSHISGKKVICGHTSQRDGVPFVLPHGVCIDTYAHGPGGWLTCLDTATGEYGQGNQRGEFRTGKLDLSLWQF